MCAEPLGLPWHACIARVATPSFHRLTSLGITAKFGLCIGRGHHSSDFPRRTNAPPVRRPGYYFGIGYRNSLPCQRMPKKKRFVLAQRCHRNQQ